VSASSGAYRRVLLPSVDLVTGGGGRVPRADF
jgi:hypothetical protein